MKTFETAGQAAAAWWTDKISGRVVHDNGDRSFNGAFATVAAGLLADTNPKPADDKFVQFASTLAATIDDRLTRHDHGVSLGCDYGPDLILADAAEALGIPFSRFPWKTNMWVHKDHVTVSAGYRAQAVLVWSASGWDRPTCRSQRGEKSDRAEDYGWRYLPGMCGRPMYHEGEHGDWVASALCGECGKPEHWPDHERTDYREPLHAFVATAEVD